MTRYRSTQCWLHLPTQSVIDACKYKPSDTTDYYRADSRFEAEVAATLYKWCKETGSVLSFQQRIPLNSGKLLLRRRFWTCDFMVETRNSSPILVEAKGQLDLRFKDVMTFLELSGKLKDLIVVGQTPQTCEAINKLFNNNRPSPCEVVLLRRLDYTLYHAINF